MAGELLRRLREAAGFAQQDWASWLDVSRRTVQRWEAGQAVPDARTEDLLVALCLERHLPVDVDALRSSLGEARARDRDGVPGLVGRDGDVAEVLRLLGTRRLVTLTGTGGVGKTSVALLALRQVRQRVVVVELAGVRDPALVAGAVAAECSVAARGGTSLRAALVAALGSEPVVLLLDNFEHLLAATPVVDDLLAACPALRVLVTSRRPLGLRDECPFEVEPLGVPPVGTPVDRLDDWAAVRMFVARCRAAGSSLPFGGEDAAAVAEICRRVDGLPLAIELAAARTNVLTPRALLARLEARLPLLSNPSPARPERHRGLRATIGWSLDLVGEQAHAVFSACGAFAGTFTVDAVEQVAGVDAVAALDGLGELVEHRLVRRSGGDGEPRLAMLDTVHEHAVDLLAARGDAATVHARFELWAIGVAEAAAGALRHRGHLAAIARVADEEDNLRAALVAALARGDARAAGRLAVAMAPWWDATSRLLEASEWLERLLALEGLPSAARATAQVWCGYFASLTGDLARAEALATSALLAWEAAGVDAGIAYAELVLGGVAMERGHDGVAAGRLTRSLAAFEASGDVWGSIRARNNLGELSAARGDAVTAARQHREAVALARRIDDVGGLPNLLCALGHALVTLGDPAGAGAAADEAVELARASGSRLHLAMALEVTGRAALARGDAWAGARALGAAAGLRRRIGVPGERRDRTVVAAAADEARAALGERRFGDAWRDGSAVND